MLSRKRRSTRTTRMKASRWGKRTRPSRVEEARLRKLRANWRKRAALRRAARKAARKAVQKA
eukprot:5395395-Pleurochrysis_carterae.AAC.1